MLLEAGVKGLVTQDAPVSTGAERGARRRTCTSSLLRLTCVPSQALPEESSPSKITIASYYLEPTLGQGLVGSFCIIIASLHRHYDLEL